MPPEARRAAFFDVDNTLLDLKSMFSYQAYFYRRQGAEQGYDGALRFAAFVEDLHTQTQGPDRGTLNRLYYRSFAGRERSVTADWAREWFIELLAQRGEALWITPVIELAERLRREGYRLVAVSGSCPEILTPVVEHLRFDDCLATALEVVGGRYTGVILPPQMIGTGKGEAIRAYAREAGIDLAQSVCCGDHLSDLSMFEATAGGWVVAGDPALEALAAERGWPVLRGARTQDALVHV